MKAGFTYPSLLVLHAEVTALEKAKEMGLSPSRVTASKTMCDDCQKYIEKMGGIIEDAYSAFWE